MSQPSKSGGSEEIRPLNWLRRPISRSKKDSRRSNSAHSENSKKISKTSPLGGLFPRRNVSQNPLPPSQPAESSRSGYEPLANDKAVFRDAQPSARQGVERTSPLIETAQNEVEQPAAEGSPLQTVEAPPASRNTPLFEKEFKTWKRDHPELYESLEKKLRDTGPKKWDELLSFSTPEGPGPKKQTTALFQRLKSQLPSLASVKGVVMSLSNLDPHKIAPLICAACFFAVEISLNVQDPQLQDKFLDHLCSTTGIINRWILYEKYSMKNLNTKSAVTDEMNRLRDELPLLYSEALEFITDLHRGSRSILQRFTGKNEPWNNMCRDLNHQHTKCSQIAAEAEEKIKDQEMNKKILDWIADPDPKIRHTSIKKDLKVANPSPPDDPLSADDLPPRVGDWFTATTEFQACKVISHFQAFFSGKVELAYYYCFGSDTRERDKGPSYKAIVRALCHQLSWDSDGIRAPAIKFYNHSTSRSDNLPTIDKWVELLRELLNSVQDAAPYRPVVFVIDALDECKDGEDQLDFLELIKGLHEDYHGLHIFFSSRDRESATGRLMSHIQTFGAKSREADANIERYIKDQLALKKTAVPSSERRHEESIFSTDDIYHGRLLKALSETANGIVNYKTSMYRWVVVWLGVFFPRKPIDSSDVAEMLLDQIEDFANPKTPKRDLDLNIAYKSLWDTNAEDHEGYIQNRIFHLVLCTFQPLTPDQLLHAVRFNPKNPDVYEGNLKIEGVQRRYHNFLSTDSNGFLQFEHISAKAFVLAMKEKDSECVWEEKGPEEQLFSESRNHQLMAEISVAMLQNPKHQLWNGSGIDLLDWEAQLSGKDIFENTPFASFAADGRKYEFLRSKIPGLLEIRAPKNFAQYVTANWTRHSRLAELGSNKKFKNMKLSQLLGFQGWCFGLAIFATGIYVVEPDLSEVASSALDSFTTNEVGEMVVDPFLCFASFGNRPFVIDEQEVRRLAAIANKEDLRSFRGNTPLYIACSHNNSGIVKLILDGGASVNKEGGYYGTALHIASGKGHEEVVRLLIKKGAEIYTKRERNSDTALCLASRHGYLKVAQILIEEGADVNQKGGHDGTAIVAAAWAGSVEIVKMLIEAGADVNQEGGYYGTAIVAAAWVGSVEIVKMLIKAGADVNQGRGYYGTALQGATHTNSVEMAKMLIKAGADIDALGGHDRTRTRALNTASRYSQLERMKLLIEAGADVNAEGGHPYRTALEAARQNGNGSGEAVDLLLQAGAKELEDK